MPRHCVETGKPKGVICSTLVKDFAPTTMPSSAASTTLSRVLHALFEIMAKYKDDMAEAGTLVKDIAELHKGRMYTDAILKSDFVY